MSILNRARVPIARRALSRGLAQPSQPQGHAPAAVRPAQPLSPFAGAATTSGSKWAPHHAPLSHAPTTFASTQRFMEQGIQKTAQEYIDSVPVIEVNGPTAICDGGDPRLGHPIEYIQLNRAHEGPATCKYCGLRYQMAHGAHGGH